MFASVPAISASSEYSKISVSPQEQYLLPAFITHQKNFAHYLCLLREYTTFNCRIEPQNKTPSENRILSARLNLAKRLMFLSESASVFKIWVA